MYNIKVLGAKSFSINDVHTLTTMEVWIIEAFKSTPRIPGFINYNVGINVRLFFQNYLTI